MQNANVLSVSQVNNYITAVFKAEELLHDIAIMGEVSNFGIKGGYAYFSIKDENATIPCVCFSMSGNHTPKDGESVLVVGSVTYYAKTGRISFLVRKISALGQGALYARFEQLRQKLSSEGIFSDSNKKQIPQFPMNVAVITSKSGAVIHDIATTIRKNNPKTNISLFDVRVQGDEAANEIVDAISVADTMNYDVIIVARGGGSFEDLLPYYDERVARAVYGAKTPVISAVGHEVDVTFCDFAADLRVATPTAAGEVASFNLMETMRKVKNSLNYIHSAVDFKFKTSRNDLKRNLDRINYNAHSFFLLNKTKLLTKARNVSDLTNIKFDASSKKLNELINRISAENPLSILKKGALFPYSREKRLNEEDISNAKVGDEFSLRGMNVDIDVVVKNICKR